MVAIADKNEKTYRTGDMYYNKKFGFHDREQNPWEASAFIGLDKDELGYFIHMDEWEEAQHEYTIDELFRIVGYPFKIKFE